MNLQATAKQLDALEKAELRGDDCAGYEIEDLLEAIHQNYPRISVRMDKLIAENKYQTSWAQVLTMATKEMA